ncbi:VOC family protein [Amycolatopsis suaedae]|uniref:VOC family protein n=1 Tax=Amycolatopsis suaedae TaxID=2510978 RepID=UPI0013EF4D64|nr:VOC family protein [Amycolatopsis suaedae]
MTFCWMDVKTHDVAATAASFEHTFGWTSTVDESDRRRATVIRSGEHRIGGLSDLANPVYPPGTPAHIAFYLATDDTDLRTERAVAAGARLVAGPFDAGDQGRMATLVDPAGAAFSLWQAGKFAGWDVPPGTLVHISEAPETARRFYADILGFDGEFTEGPDPRWELRTPAGLPVRVGRGLPGDTAQQ